MIRLMLLLATLLSTTGAWAWRCGSSLIEEGDRKSEVLEDCGKPEARYSQQVAYELEIGASHRRRRYQAVDYWVYIPGWNRFARILYFNNGVLEDIRQGLHGRDYDGDPEHCRQGDSIPINHTRPEVELRCGPADERQVIEEYTRPVTGDDNTRIVKNVVVEDWLYYDDNNDVSVYRFENGVLKWQGQKDRDEYNLLSR